MLIWTFGRGDKRRVKSFGLGSLNKQLSELMSIARYTKRRARYMIDVEREIFHQAPIPRKKEEVE